jgi:hypothetical protein
MFLLLSCADCVLQAVQLVPALPTRLLPMLVQNMPHKLRDRSAQCLYLGALISLCEGKVGPALREGLLGGLVEHLLSIDADIRWEDIVDAPTGGAGACVGGGGGGSRVPGSQHTAVECTACTMRSVSCLVLVCTRCTA